MQFAAVREFSNVQCSRYPLRKTILKTYALRVLLETDCGSTFYGRNSGINLGVLYYRFSRSSYVVLFSMIANDILYLVFLQLKI